MNNLFDLKWRRLSGHKKDCKMHFSFLRVSSNGFVLMMDVTKPNCLLVASFYKILVCMQLTIMAVSPIFSLS